VGCLMSTLSRVLEGAAWVVAVVVLAVAIEKML
jgi:hypothetical protein